MTSAATIPTTTWPGPGTGSGRSTRLSTSGAPNEATWIACMSSTLHWRRHPAQPPTSSPVEVKARPSSAVESGRSARGDVWRGGTAYDCPSGVPGGGRTSSRLRVSEGCVGRLSAVHVICRRSVGRGRDLGRVGAPHEHAARAQGVRHRVLRTPEPTVGRTPAAVRRGTELPRHRGTPGSATSPRNSSPPPAPSSSSAAGTPRRPTPPLPRSARASRARGCGTCTWTSPTCPP